MSLDKPKSVSHQYLKMASRKVKAIWMVLKKIKKIEGEIICMI